MPSDSARLAVVQQCVQQIWMARANGEWAALERHLIIVLTGGVPMSEPARPGISAAERRVGQRRKNVILLSDYLERRRPRERRKPKPTP